jgi:hypothetical protein
VQSTAAIDSNPVPGGFRWYAAEIGPRFGTTCYPLIGFK